MNILDSAVQRVAETRAEIPSERALSWDIHFAREAGGAWLVELFLASAYDPFSDEDEVPVASCRVRALDVSGENYRLNVCGEDVLIWFGESQEMDEPLAISRELVAELMEPAGTSELDARGVEFRR